MYRIETMNSRHERAFNRLRSLNHMQSNAKPVNGYDYDNTHMYTLVSLTQAPLIRKGVVALYFLFINCMSN